jgi:hypothetical protein
MRAFSDPEAYVFTVSGEEISYKNHVKVSETKPFMSIIMGPDGKMKVKWEELAYGKSGTASAIKAVNIVKYRALKAAAFTGSNIYYNSIIGFVGYNYDSKAEKDKALTWWKLYFNGRYWQYSEVKNIKDLSDQKLWTYHVGELSLSTNGEIFQSPQRPGYSLSEEMLDTMERHSFNPTTNPGGYLVKHIGFPLTEKTLLKEFDYPELSGYHENTDSRAASITNGDEKK